LLTKKEEEKKRTSDMPEPSALEAALCEASDCGSGSCDIRRGPGASGFEPVTGTLCCSGEAGPGRSSSALLGV
jgi:hypothetical protein